MKMSRRARRMERNHKRNSRGSGLNLVSLMDIFTILVFFLLVNSSSVQELPNSKSVKLPQSTSDRLPEETLLLLVSGDHILLQGQLVVRIVDIAQQQGLVIPQLLDGLRQHVARRGLLRVDTDGETLTAEVTIMGDRALPYHLLKRIMATCTEANFTNIALAVSRKPREKV
ncbi:MAG: biopolymer transporter ExbD [Gammaproteobacteria bacterium]|nr:biopolymer transporter ExbD [Gammaproteobacteria bacterium]